MTVSIAAGAVVAASLLSLLFSTLTFALRDFSRGRLEDYLEAAGRREWFESTVRHSGDLVFVTALLRLLSNIAILIGVLRLFHDTDYSLTGQYLLSVVVTAIITLFVSVAVPHALANHAGETFIGFFVRPLHGLRLVLMPVTKLMHAIDSLVGKAAGAPSEPEQIEEDLEQEIISMVEEGQKEGVVGRDEREMIESVIEFGDTHVGQIMTPRPEIIAIEAGTPLEQIKSVIVDHGLSRLPVFEGDLDHIVGILYARDLLKYLGKAETFDIRKSLRPVVYVPETKPLADLLREFRVQKMHIAIVLDEYGGTSGLVTIEDVLEEIVGDISDEHEPKEIPLVQRIDDRTYEADARVYVDQLNRDLGLDLPEDAGYDTLGGFVSTTLGRIPEPGTTLEHDHVRYTILDAEPQKVNRVRIELALQPAASEEST